MDKLVIYSIIFSMGVLLMCYVIFWYRANLMMASIVALGILCMFNTCLILTMHRKIMSEYK